ncbi:MAG: hypothetical protein MSK40_04320 [Parabacteroides sp.]|nr:hypothetical protein [Parabacteroides sp.]
MSVESQVKKAISQEIKVTIGDKEYKVKKPTLHTLLMVCDDIAELMSADGVDITDNNVLIPHMVKMIRHDAWRQARIIATFIIEAKNINEWVEKRYKRKIFGIKVYEDVYRNNIAELTEKIMDTIGCREANSIIAECLSFGDIGFFLQTSISLKGANMSSPTKTEATARGE